MRAQLWHWSGCRFAITGSSDKLVRLWSIEEVYRQAVEAAWGVPAPPNPADSAQSTHTAAAAEDGQEVSQGKIESVDHFPWFQSVMLTVKETTC